MAPRTKDPNSKFGFSPTNRVTGRGFKTSGQTDRLIKAIFTTRTKDRKVLLSDAEVITAQPPGLAAATERLNSISQYITNRWGKFKMDQISLRIVASDEKSPRRSACSFRELVQMKLQQAKARTTDTNIWKEGVQTVLAILTNSICHLRIQSGWRTEFVGQANLQDIQIVVFDGQTPH